jgi:signal transduction histidine kinase
MPVVGAAAVAVGALLATGDTAWFSPDRHPESTTTAHVLALTLPSAFFMLVAGVGFARSVLKQRNIKMGLLGAAAVLLAAAWSQSLPVPRLTANSVSGRECLCAGAFALILLFAFNSHRELRRAQADELAAAERRRLVGDLHDGIAQDLAFIATYAERLVKDFGPEHPLTVAARRALAASRGVIADVSATYAPNAAAALRAVAHELSVRHGVSITVEADGEDLTAPKREAVVRIAREAIVNAVQHGQAKHIAVSLETRDNELALRISDDGRGLRDGVAADPLRGFGLRAMRERAAAIGGDLMMDELSEGGTAVEAVVS